MTGAERQARWRAARATGTPVIRARRSPDRRSRIQRWNDAVTAIETLQAEYAAWLDALPENQQDGVLAETLRTIAELDLSELQAIAPPRGFGRDRTTKWPVRHGPRDRPRQGPASPDPSQRAASQGERAEGDDDRSNRGSGEPVQTHGPRGRNIVRDRVADPIWASGHRGASTGRTHERSRSAVKILAKALEPKGPSTHESEPILRAETHYVRFDLNEYY
jgi:hypothetical protein